MPAFYLVIFIIGACLGSFLSVILTRLGREEGILAGRSHCPSCHHLLSWYELVPLFSYAIQKGQCRHCRTGISIKYPFLELAAGSAAVIFTFNHQPINFQNHWFYFYLLAVLILLFFYDFLYLILPDKIIYPAIAVAALYQARSGSNFSGAIISALTLALFFAIIYGVSRGKWLGFGDVKLAFLVGLSFGWPWSLIIMIAAVWLGALTAVTLLTTGRATRKTALPFGSFTTLAAIVFILFDHEVIKILEKFF